MANTFIYALCEPGTRTVRYIGKTAYPKRRLRDHLVVSSTKRTHLGHWIAALISRGQEPAFVELRKVPHANGNETERKYINLARRLGMDLVNSTDGGEGILNPSPETRARMSAASRGHTVSKEVRDRLRAAHLGKTHSPETLAKMSLRHKGVPWTEARYAAHKKDKPRSEKQLAVILAVNARKKGVALSAEHRAKISSGITGEKNPFFGKKHTEETLIKMRRPKPRKNYPTVCAPIL